MKVWVTRTQPAAGRTAARLRDLGLEALVDPVLAVRPLETAIDLTGFDALAFTSGNAVRAFANLTARRDRPVFAVGAATAEALGEIGFRDVRSADGDLEALARLLIEARPGRVLAPGPTLPAGDLTALAAPGGVEVKALPIYETVPIRPREAPAARLDAVLIQSARAAQAVADDLAGLAVFAISDAAAAPLKGRPMRALHIAPFPDEPSLLKLCAETLSETP